MNYGYKVTTDGREILAALLATGKALNITRVAVGSGRVAEDTNLADMNAGLVHYIADGKIAQRRHQDNVLYLTVQYASNFTPGLGAFYLSEFIVEAEHPISGESKVLLYATLGDYIQPVMGYSETQAPDIRNYPIILAISDEINVNISVPPGLITLEDMEAAIDAALANYANGVGSAIIRRITVPSANWEEIGEGAEGFGDYKFTIHVPVEKAKEMHFPVLALDIPSLSVAGEAEMCQTIETLDGVVRLWAKAVPAADLTGTILLRSENLVDLDIATDEEVDDAVDDIFGEGSSGNLPSGYEVATDEEVKEVLNDIFG